MKLKIEYVNINSIKPYENNAKLHPEEQIEQISNKENRSKSNMIEKLIEDYNK